MIRFSRLKWLIIGLACVVLVGLTYIEFRSPSDVVVPYIGERPSIKLPFELNGPLPPGHIGWAACAGCHGPRVREFQRTRHFQALRLADQVELPAGFHAGKNSFQPPASPVRFEMAAGPPATITSVPVVGHGVNPTVSPVSFVYGAGAGTDEVYFTRRKDELFELPVVWLHPRQEWGATQFDPFGSGDLSRPLAPQCLECHTVWVDFERGSLNRYGPLEPQLVGVTCERCHGPGQAHVEHHRAHPQDRFPVEIVRPKSLSRDRQMDLCAQCHTNAVRHRRPPFSYRAGEPLDDSFRILEMRLPEENRVANQVRYLKESRCYQQSENLTCINCHDPHRQPDKDRSQAANRSCLSCHQPETCGARDRLPEAVQDRCAACHMPRRNKVQVSFETADGDIVFPAPRFEHRIAVYPETEQEMLWEWYGTRADDEFRRRRTELARILTDHWSRLADEAAGARRFVVAIDAYRTAIKFDASEELQTRLTEVMEMKRQTKALWFQAELHKREKRLDEAISIFESLLELQPGLAKAQLELGTSYAATGQTDRAVTLLKAAWENDPNDPGAPAMLGWLEFLAGRPAGALEYYDRAAEIEPWSDRIEQMRGECLASLGRWDEAAQAYLRSLTIDPQYTESIHGLRRILRERFSPADALPLAIESVQVTRARDVELLLTLVEIYRDSGDISEARQTVAYARQFAESSGSSLLPRIRAVEQSLDSGRSAAE